jgi:hypothetical protein
MIDWQDTEAAIVAALGAFEDGAQKTWRAACAID